MTILIKLLITIYTNGDASNKKKVVPWIGNSHFTDNGRSVIKSRAGNGGKGVGNLDVMRRECEGCQ
jgi:hypothetical protein